MYDSLFLPKLINWTSYLILAEYTNSSSYPRPYLTLQIHAVFSYPLLTTRDWQLFTDTVNNLMGCCWFDFVGESGEESGSAKNSGVFTYP